MHAQSHKHSQTHAFTSLQFDLFKAHATLPGAPCLLVRRPRPRLLVHRPAHLKSHTQTPLQGPCPTPWRHVPPGPLPPPPPPGLLTSTYANISSRAMPHSLAPPAFESAAPAFSSWSADQRT
eukprot:355370-Chlamydomonas_euryale.AAC.2